MFFNHKCNSLLSISPEISHLWLTTKEFHWFSQISKSVQCKSLSVDTESFVREQNYSYNILDSTVAINEVS